jgi:hypothetical protein
MHLPFALVLTVTAIGFLRIFMYNWREGTTLIAVALLLAAALRAVLSDEQAGLIMIRSRVADVLCYTTFGVLLAIMALTIKASPLG